MINYTLSQFNPAYSNNQGNPGTVYNTKPQGLGSSNPALTKVPSYWELMQKANKRMMAPKPPVSPLPHFNY